jgi:hypothetical protein
MYAPSGQQCAAACKRPLALLHSIHVSGVDDGPACEPPCYRYRRAGAACPGNLLLAPRPRCRSGLSGLLATAGRRSAVPAR